jgi:hypothetical protein
VFASKGTIKPETRFIPSTKESEMLRATVLLISFFLLAVSVAAFAAPKADLWPRWENHDPVSDKAIDHSAWGAFLAAYLVTDNPSGVYLVRYGEVTQESRARLQGYLEMLEKTIVSDLNRDEQAAFWINLYNALTVEVVLEHYPVESIRDIDISPGWFSDGPWGAKLVTIEGQKISLDDIEHRILRPIWKDPRLHYVVNCASIGCPNLQPEPFTAENLELLYERGARQYVNHPRGAEIRAGDLILSSIYDWFQQDFDGSEQAVLAHLQKYGEPALRKRIATFNGSISYRYDWTLNDPALR